MIPLPRIHEPEEAPPARRVVPSWVAAGIVSLGSVLVMAYTGATLTQDARQAARECRQAADELRQERERLADERRKEEASRVEGVGRAVSLNIQLDRLREKVDDAARRLEQRADGANGVP